MGLTFLKGLFAVLEGLVVLMGLTFLKDQFADLAGLAE